jgi:hypothetical protein
MLKKILLTGLSFILLSAFSSSNSSINEPDLNDSSLDNVFVSVKIIDPSNKELGVVVIDYEAIEYDQEHETFFFRINIPTQYLKQRIEIKRNKTL